MANNKTFYLAGGKTFSSLKTFAKELREMPLDVYSFHVNKEKNDFANWMRNSLSKDELAERVDGHLEKIQLELEVLRHLIFEEDTKKPKKKALTKPKQAKKEEPKKAKTEPKPKKEKKVKEAKKPLTKKVVAKIKPKQVKKDPKPVKAPTKQAKKATKSKKVALAAK